eukprot:1391817-Amorphochlora_amoeboformis.AAC.1
MGQVVYWMIYRAVGSFSHHSLSRCRFQSGNLNTLRGCVVYDLKTLRITGRFVILPCFASRQTRLFSAFLDSYKDEVKLRAEEGIVPQPLNADKAGLLIEELKAPESGEEADLMSLLETRSVASLSDMNYTTGWVERGGGMLEGIAWIFNSFVLFSIPAGVDEAAYVKASFLSAVAKGTESSPLVSKEKAVELLGTMQGGYNISTLIDLLDDAALAPLAGKCLSHTILMFDAFHDVEDKAKAGNEEAKKPEVPEKITVTVFKVTGETNTDDLSPAPDAWSRPDIPKHALAMLKMGNSLSPVFVWCLTLLCVSIAREGIEPDKDGEIGPMKQIEALKEKGFPLAYVGDVVGTGSSRKSATNSVLWHMGEDIPYVPNKRGGGVCIGGKIAPIFFNTMEDSGALPIEMDVSKLSMGD